MKRFVTKRKIKLPRYKILVGYTSLLVVLIILSNIGVKFFLKKDTNLVNRISNNILGYPISLKNEFFKQIFGFKYAEEKEVFKEYIDKPIVYIYNTFQTQKYKNNYYNSYNINPVVTQASMILGEYIKKEGIGVYIEKESVAKTLKDNNISYSLSYRGSRILMEEAKKNNPSIEYYIDIQVRDRKYNETTKVIDNKSYAGIEFIVGTDNRGRNGNEEMAYILSEMLGGVSLGVKLQGGVGYHGVYNQDISSKSMLVYVGGEENTIDEVNRSLEVFSKVITKYIKEREDEKEKE